MLTDRIFADHHDHFMIFDDAYFQDETLDHLEAIEEHNRRYTAFLSTVARAFGTMWFGWNRLKPVETGVYLFAETPNIELGIDNHFGGPALFARHKRIAKLPPEHDTVAKDIEQTFTDLDWLYPDLFSRDMNQETHHAPNRPVP